MGPIPAGSTLSIEIARVFLNMKKLLILSIVFETELMGIKGVNKEEL